MFEKTFCSSPWFHIRINYNGDFISCRWHQKSFSDSNIRNSSIMQFYNSEQMRNLRLEMLNGSKPKECNVCYYQDEHGKLSGRVKQLNKSGVIQNHFGLSLKSSPHYKYFEHSLKHDGESNYYPVDLQIDLGNICNSACIMCAPSASSRLAQDYVKLSKISPLFTEPENYLSWTRDTVDKFVRELITIPNIRYIHFLGGETLYDPAFYLLCDKLIEHGLSKNIIVGTTTNGTIYDERIERLIPEFKEFHLGISIESVTKLNDYIRYPSEISAVLKNIDKFLKLRETTNLYTSLRITPNVFTISELDRLFEFMLVNNIAAESCNILNHPEHLKIELMPDDIRRETIKNLKSFIERNQLEKTNEVNVRRPDLIREAIGDLAIEYKSFLETYAVPENADELRKRLVEFLKAFESIRSNSIIEHAPRYEEFLRHCGY